MAWKQILSLGGLIGLCAGRKISSCFCEQTERIHHILHTLGNAVFQILIIGAVLYFLYRGIKQCLTWLIHYIAKQSEASEDNNKTLCYVLQSCITIIKWIFIGVFIITILSECGIKLMPMLYGLGLTAIPITIGAQNTFKNIVDGIFFIFSNEARIGDHIQAGGHEGVIEVISVQGITLRKLDGSLTYIPFSQLGTITNFNSDYTIIQGDLSFPSHLAIQTVIQVIHAAIDELKQLDIYRDHIQSQITITFLSVNAEGINVRVKFKTKTDQFHEFKGVVINKIVEKIEEYGKQEKDDLLLK